MDEEEKSSNQFNIFIVIQKSNNDKKKKGKKVKVEKAKPIVKETAKEDKPVTQGGKDTKSQQKVTGKKEIVSEKEILKVSKEMSENKESKLDDISNDDNLEGKLKEEFNKNTENTNAKAVLDKMDKGDIQKSKQSKK